MARRSGSARSPSGWCRPAMCWAARRRCWSMARPAASSSPATTSAGPTRPAPPFEPVPCDVFVTEATFGLPVFRHPPTPSEIGRLLHSRRAVPGAHAPGRRLCAGQGQRVIALLRAGRLGAADLPARRAWRRSAGSTRTLGVDLGELRPPTGAEEGDLPGAIVLAPPSAIADRWARRFAEPVTAVASGWMRVRARARQARRRAAAGDLRPRRLGRADCRRCDEVSAPEVWVTHGREEALIHAVDAAAASAAARWHLVGRGEEDETAAMERRRTSGRLREQTQPRSARRREASRAPPRLSPQAAGAAGRFHVRDDPSPTCSMLAYMPRATASCG